MALSDTCDYMINNCMVMTSHCFFPMYVVAGGARKIISGKKEEERLLSGKPVRM